MTQFADGASVARLALLGLSILGGCAEEPTPSCASDDGCSENAQTASAQRDAGKDAGKRDGAVARDAGKVDSGALKDAMSASAVKKAALPCDVEAVLGKHCSTCHGDEAAFGAPMSLTTIADFETSAISDEAKSTADLVTYRINASDARVRMPPTSSKQLTAVELAVLNEWIEAGTPGSNESCGAAVGDAGSARGDASQPDAEAGDPNDDPTLKCYKLLASNGDGKTPFKVGAVRDGYFNAVVWPPWKGNTVYARVMRPVIDNKEVIHHWLLFQDDSPGTVGAPVKGSGAHPSGQLLMGWAPGGEAWDFRAHGDDLGIELPGNTTYTIEFHYNSDDAAAVDASGVELCVSSTKPTNVAGVSWLGNDNLLIPSNTWTGTCAPTTSSPIHLIYLTPHMHLQGRHQKAVINRKNGTKEPLLDQAFDFNYQVSYETDKVLNQGDSITTTCTFAQPMTFGESTTAEMCYMFTVAYPKGALADSGGWGGVAHGGSSCLGM